MRIIIPDTKTSINILMMLAAAIVIFIFLPSPDKHDFKYTIGEPWAHEQIIAPFDIEVPFAPEKVQMAQDSIDNFVIPILRIDNSPLQAYYAAIDTCKAFDPARKRIVKNEIQQAYKKGVIADSLRQMLYKYRDRYVAENIKPNILVNSIDDQGNYKQETYRDWDKITDMRTPDNAYHLLYKIPTELNLLGITSLEPNYVVDELATQTKKDELMVKYLGFEDIVHSGTLIITRGVKVDDKTARIIDKYVEKIDRLTGHTANQSINFSIGRALLVILVMGLLYTYLYLYRREVLKQWRRLACILLLMTTFLVMAVFAAGYINFGLYIMPLVIIPILLVVFYDSFTAMFVMTLQTILCATFALYPLEFIFVEMVAGMVAIFTMRELSRRSQLMSTAAYVLGAYVLSYIAIELSQVATVSSLSWKLIGFFAINTVLTSFAYILIFVIEKLFGFTSVVTLVELSDINNPILRELSTQCPGTFQHSMAVGNLVSNAAHRIGANVQLVRAGALYHDIGKLKQPLYFTENQHGVNPHDALADPKESARIIIEHVTDGLRRAEKAKLPRVIRDMIVQHHGRSTARYFYTQYCNAHPDEQVDPADFTYPGPNPQTKEASLLMMADVVEAASRSLPDHSPESISRLVNKLVDAQVAEGLHKDSPLSFRDISEIKRAFIETLRTMYHTRIAYPERKQPAQAPATDDANNSKNS